MNSRAIGFFDRKKQCAINDDGTILLVLNDHNLSAPLLLRRNN